MGRGHACSIAATNSPNSQLTHGRSWSGCVRTTFASGTAVPGSSSDKTPPPLPALNRAVSRTSSRLIRASCAVGPLTRCRPPKSYETCAYRNCCSAHTGTRQFHKGETDEHRCDPNREGANLVARPSRPRSDHSTGPGGHRLRHSVGVGPGRVALEPGCGREQCQGAHHLSRAPGCSDDPVRVGGGRGDRK